MNYSDMIEKAKYISRKKVKGKWVYKYPDDKKGSRKKSPTSVSVKDVEYNDDSISLKTNSELERYATMSTGGGPLMEDLKQQAKGELKRREAEGSYKKKENPFENPQQKAFKRVTALNSVEHALEIRSYPVSKNRVSVSMLRSGAKTAATKAFRANMKVLNAIQLMKPMDFIKE